MSSLRGKAGLWSLCHRRKFCCRATRSSSRTTPDETRMTTRMSWLYTSKIAAGRSLTRLGVAMATTASSLRVLNVPLFLFAFLVPSPGRYEMFLGRRLLYCRVPWSITTRFMRGASRRAEYATRSAEQHCAARTQTPTAGQAATVVEYRLASSQSQSRYAAKRWWKPTSVASRYAIAAPPANASSAIVVQGRCCSCRT